MQIFCRFICEIKKKAVPSASCRQLRWLPRMVVLVLIKMRK